MSRAAGARGSSGGAGTRAGAPLPAGYLEKSQLPLTGLLFLLPLMVLYELGTQYLTFDAVHHTEQRIVAFQLMQQFFGLFGASGRYLPAVTISIVMLSWHIARKDAWELDFPTAGCMVMESFALCAPLVVLNFLSARYVSFSTGGGSWSSLLVLSIGAGIYEELVFRLVGFTLLSVLLSDLLRIRRGWSLLVTVAVSSILFSAYHYWGSEVFTLRTFIFRTLGGIYFGLIFIHRGFGITCGAHAAYDILIVLYSAAAAT